MQIDIALDNVRVYNIEKADIVTGEKFTLTVATPEISGKLKWFTDNDPALDIELTEDTGEINVVAGELGKSTILIMDESFKILKTLTLNIVDDINPIARKINAVIGTPVAK